MSDSDIHPAKRQKVIQVSVEKDCTNDDKPCSSYDNVSDWREVVINNKERQKHALTQGILTDVTFSVGPEKKLFHAHKIILALASPVFEAMFYGSLKEKNEQISITDLAPSGFQLLLNYIYTDDMNFTNETEAFLAWIAADKYCMSQMKNMCYKYLSSCDLSNSNIWVTLEYSLFLDLQRLVDRCLSYLKVNIANAIKHPGFLEVRSETIQKILMMDLLFIKEASLFRSIVQWSEEKIKNGAEETLQQLIQPFLKYIRFGCMAQAEFVSFIDEYKNVISDSDALAILKFMTDEKLYSLPDWCSHTVYSRQAYSRQRDLSQTLCSNIMAYTLRPQQNVRPGDQNNRFTDDPNNIRRYHHPDNLLYNGYREEDNSNSRDHIVEIVENHEDWDLINDFARTDSSDDTSDDSPRPALNEHLDSDDSDSSSSSSSPSSNSSI